MPSDPLGSSLLTLARNAIGKRFGVAECAVAAHPSLQDLGATFVTLTQDGQLRGCIGSLEAIARWPTTSPKMPWLPLFATRDSHC